MADRIDIIVKLQDLASKGFRSLGKAMKDSLKQMISFRTALVGLVTVTAGAAFLKDTIQTFAEFDDTMRQVGAVTNASKEQMIQMSQVAKDLGATTRFSASQAADGFRLLGMAGFGAKEAIAALPGVLNLAAAGSLDLGTAADIATNVLSGFGLEIEKLGRVNDVLVQTFTSSNTTLVEIGEAFKLVGPIAKGVGADFEDLVGSIGLLGNAGLKGTLAGTALRGAINALLNPTKEEERLMGDLSKRLGGVGLQIKDSSGDFIGFASIIAQLEKAGLKGEEALALFGQRAGPGVAALLQVGGEKIQEYTDSLRRVDGVAERIAKDMEAGIGGALRELSASFEAVKIELGETFGEDLIVLVHKFRDALVDVVEKIKELRDNGTLNEWAKVIKTSFNIVIETAKAVVWAFEKAAQSINLAFSIITGQFDVTKEILKELKNELTNAGKESEQTAPKFYKIDTATGKVKDSIAELTEGIKKLNSTPIGKGGGKEKELDDLGKKIRDTLKNTVSDDTAQKVAFTKLKANLAKESAEVESAYEAQKITVEKYYQEKIRIATVAARAQQNLLKRELEPDAITGEEKSADEKAKVNAKIYTNEKQLEVSIINLKSQLEQKKISLAEQTAKEQQRIAKESAEKENQIQKAIKAVKDQELRASIDAPGFEAQHQKELADLQQRQNAELAIVEAGIAIETEKLRAKGLTDLEIKRSLAEQELDIEKYKQNQITELEKLQADQQERIFLQKLENTKQLAGGTAKLFENLYQLTGKKSKEFFYLAKAAALAEATINIAQGVTKALGQGGYYGIFMGATVAAAGAVQIATIASQGLAEGGPVQGTSPHSKADNINIRATAGEFMEPVSAVDYYGKETFELLRQKKIPREIFSGFKMPSIRYGRRRFAEGGEVTPNSGENQKMGAQQQSPINIVNVLDPATFDQYVFSTPGQKNIMNVLSENQFQLKQLVLGS